MSEIIIKGCSECPMCDSNDMAPGYSCGLVGYPNNQIKENKKWQAETPEWCPIKKEDVVFKFAK